MRDKSNQLLVVNTGRRKPASDTDNQATTKTGGSGGFGGGTVGGSQYLLKEIWDKCWEIRKTDNGEEYIFGKLPVGLQFDLTSFVDAGLIDLPTLYDGLVIDNQTIYWEKVTEEIPDEDGNIVTKVTKVLKAKGGGGTADKVTWTNIEDKPSWIGELKPEYTWDEIKDKPIWIDGSKLVYKWTSNTGAVNQETVATEEWVGDNYFSINGGQLHGDLWLRSGTENYGRRIIFGDKKSSGDPYVYIGEDSDDDLTIFATDKIEIKVSDGSVLRYDKANGYWELEGDLLVNGGITSYE